MKYRVIVDKIQKALQKNYNERQNLIEELKVTVKEDFVKIECEQDSDLFTEYLIGLDDVLTAPVKRMFYQLGAKYPDL